MKNMKNLFNLKVVTSLLVGALFIISCEKSEITTETEQIVDQQEEGFKSETGNTDEVLKIEDNATLPLLKMHFDATVSQKEAINSFNKATDEFISKQPKQNKAFSTEWYYKVWTYTGTQSYNTSNGAAGTYVTFNTSVGAYSTVFNRLNDHPDGSGWSASLFRGSVPGLAIQWVEVDYARLYLQGTNGWFVTNFVIQILPGDQTLSSAGSSTLWCYPNVYLDNTTSSAWDSYFCNPANTGRLNF